MGSIYTRLNLSAFFPFKIREYVNPVKTLIAIVTGCINSIEKIKTARKYIKFTVIDWKSGL